MTHECKYENYWAMVTVEIRGKKFASTALVNLCLECDTVDIEVAGVVEDFMHQTRD